MPISTSGGSSPSGRALLEVLLRGIDRLGRLDGWIGSICLAALTCLMIAEISVRALSNVFPGVPADVPVAWEYSSYLMATTFTFGAALALRAGVHIRVSLVTQRLRPQVSRWLEVVLAVIGTVFVGFLAASMTDFAWEAFVSDRVSVSSGTPVWLPAAAITFGLILLALQLLARTIYGLLDLPLEDRRMRLGTYVE